MSKVDSMLTPVTSPVPEGRAAAVMAGPAIDPNTVSTAF